MIAGAVLLQLPILMMALNGYRHDVWCRRLNIVASLLCVFVLVISVDLVAYIVFVAAVTVAALGNSVRLSWYLAE